MKAILFTEFQGELSVLDILIPSPSDVGVVIKVEATGLCRSDWTVGWTLRKPRAFGHKDFFWGASDEIKLSAW
jgi:alcohol dehydrogenase